MLKNRILLLLVAAILILILYNFPRRVVENTPEDPVPEETTARDHDQEPDTSALLTIENLRKALNAEGNIKKNANFADSLGHLFDAVRELDSAAKYFGIQAEIDPSTDHLIEAGNAYYKVFSYSQDQRKAEEMGARAREYFEKVLEKDPENLDVKAKMAMTLISTSRPMEGITMLRDILAKDPDNETALFNLGVLSIQSAQYDRAIQRLKRLVEIDSTDVQARYFLAVSYFESGMEKEAKGQFEKILRMDPDETVKASVDSYLGQLN